MIISNGNPSRSFDNLIHDLLDRKQNEHQDDPLQVGSLRAGGRFEGTQSTESSVSHLSYQLNSSGTVSLLQTSAAATDASRSYSVRVTLKHVDLRQDYLCGYLTIDELTDQYPQLTTFFDGDIVAGITHRHSFATHRWGADESIDVEHWRKFVPFRNAMDRDAGIEGVRDMDGKFSISEDDVREEKVKFVFMRWKEQFLVPDYRIKSVQGASYDGFYYIMYDAENDSIEGYYYHDSSERNQHLQLKPVGRERSGSFDFN